MEEEIVDWIASSTKKKRRKARLPTRTRRAEENSDGPLQFTPKKIANGLVFLFILGVLAIALSLIAEPLALYYYGANNPNLMQYEISAGSVALEIAMLLSVIVYLRAWKKESWRGLCSILGLNLRRLSLRNIGIGVAIFLVVMLFSVAVSLVGFATNTSVSTNIGILLAQQPLWFYAFAALISPVCEEVLFRAFSVPRLGIIVSAVIFGLLHASYNSTFGIEIFAAMIFALLAGYFFKRTKSLYPSIVAHILVNAVGVLAYVL